MGNNILEDLVTTAGLYGILIFRSFLVVTILMARGWMIGTNAMQDQTPMRRFCFKLGNIEPDFNPVTYLRGFKTVEHFRGHNYRNVCDTIRHLTFNLLYTGDNNAKTYYYLGKLCHYTTDAFTYPHNVTFEGTIRQHIQYEKALKWYFIRFILQNPTPPVLRPYSGTLYDQIDRIHRQYLRSVPNRENDSAFTLQAVSNIMDRIASCFMAGRTNH